jgi:signal peptide peptidase SppA
MGKPSLADLFQGPMLIEPQALQSSLAPLLAGGEHLDRIAKMAATARARPTVAGGLAVIPIRGVLTPSPSWVSEMMGWSTVDDILAQVRQHEADPQIKTVLFDVASPGGSVSGLAECADGIFGLRASKKTVALSRWTMASAAYWLGSAASSVIACPLSETGGIGVWVAHVDDSGAAEAAGIKVTIFKAGKYKAEGVYGPLSPEAAEHLQGVVDAIYAAFTGAVAKHRGVSAKDVTKGYGEGRALLDQKAKEAGLVDRVLSAEALGARLLSGSKVALCEGVEVEASDWAALGFACLEEGNARAASETPEVPDLAASIAREQEALALRARVAAL